MVMLVRLIGCVYRAARCGEVRTACPPGFGQHAVEKTGGGAEAGGGVEVGWRSEVGGR